MEEKITGTQRAFDGRIVKLDIHDVVLPDGEKSKREVVAHPGAVAMVALDDVNNVLLVRQYRIAAGKVMIEIPAGTLEPDEAPIICAERELQEETGYKPGSLESIGGMYTAPGYTTEFIHLFLATDLSESVLDQDADEFIELVRMPIADALKQIEIGAINDGKTVVGLMRVATRLGL